MRHIKNWKASKRVDGKNTPSNKDRAYCAEVVLEYYYEVKEGRVKAHDSLDTCLLDLLSDLSHYAASQGIEPERLFHVAYINFQSER